jgi:hypothetical protein
VTRFANPLHLIAAKQKVGQEDTDSIELMVMCHFDAAKRGQCTGAGVNFMTTHLIIASYIAARSKASQFHAIVTQAYTALKRASDRPTALLDLTAREYVQLQTAWRWYFRSMPQVEVGTMAEACAAAHQAMQG